MKIWQGYGGEHSANLHIVGVFDSAEKASKALKVILGIKEGITLEEAEKLEQKHEVSDALLDVLNKLNFLQCAPYHPRQLHYEFKHNLDGNRLEIQTEELAIEAFTTPMLYFGAKISIADPR